jgi:hypothetical protein
MELENAWGFLYKLTRTNLIWTSLYHELSDIIRLQMSDPNSMAFQLGSMADDFFFSIVILKQADSASRTLPFLHAHCLELSAKAACYKIDPTEKALGNHEIMKLYDKIATRDSDMHSILPNDTYFTGYRNFFVPENLATSYDYDNSVPRNVVSPSEFFKYEISYFIEEIIGLKYGVTKKMETISLKRYAYSEVNPEFLKIFNFCRKIYTNLQMDNRIKEKMYSKFEKTEDTDKFIARLLNL